MSRIAEIRSAIVSTLASVPDIGQVYEFERDIREESKFKTLYLYTPSDGEPQIRGWWLRRTLSEEKDFNVERTLVTDTWALRGFMALDDAIASELAFDELIETFRDKVRADPTFGGLGARRPPKDERSDGVQVVEVAPVTLCGVLCHGALLQLQTWSYV